MCAIIEIVKEILKNMLQFVFLLSLLEEDFIYYISWHVWTMDFERHLKFKPNLIVTKNPFEILNFSSFIQSSFTDFPD